LCFSIAVVLPRICFGKRFEGRLSISGAAVNKNATTPGKIKGEPGQISTLKFRD
jgi:hypothetical protein